MVKAFSEADLKHLYAPPADSHKGQNGKLMVIGGSHLFHAASLWALQIASRIVDMVFYSSVPENNQLVQNAKEEFRNGIVVERGQLENYIEEADCVLIGPGMLRTQHEVQSSTLPAGRQEFKVQSLSEINKMGDEGEQTYWLTKYLLEKYSHKKWVIDAGALQMMEASWLKQLNGNVIVTPHRQEFEKLFSNVILRPKAEESRSFANAQDDIVGKLAEEYNCVILLKGQTDVVCPPRLGEAGSSSECVEVTGGNAGMTKGGTGDVLAGLVAALACKNDLFLAAAAGSYINKKAGDSLYEKVGPYFNASDLADEIPKVMKEFVVS